MGSNARGANRVRYAMLAVATTCAAGLFAISSAPAQPAAPDSENGRYSFNTTPDGLLRLDSRTGQVSICGKREVGWFCQPAPDERAALETEIARLQAENGALKKEFVIRGIPLPGGAKPGAAASGGAVATAPAFKLPTDADIDHAASFVEKVWRRFIDMVQSLQDKAQSLHKSAERQS